MYSWVPADLVPAYEEAERALSGRYDGVSRGHEVRLVLYPDSLLNAGVVLDSSIMDATNLNQGDVTILMNSALVDFIEGTVSGYMVDVLRGTPDQVPGVGFREWLSRVRSSTAKSRQEWNAPWPGAASGVPDEWVSKYIRVPAHWVFEFVLAHELSHRVLNVPSGGNTGEEQLQRETTVDLNGFDHLGLDGPYITAMASHGELQPTFIINFFAASYYFEQTRLKIIADEADLPGQPLSVVAPARDWRVRGIAVVDHWRRTCKAHTSPTMCPVGVEKLIAEGRRFLDGR